MTDQEEFFRSIYEYRAECMEYLFVKTQCSEDEASDIFIEAGLEVFQKPREKGQEILNMAAFLQVACYNHWKRANYKDKIKKKHEDNVSRYFYDGINRSDLLDDLIEKEEAQYASYLISRTRSILETLGERCKHLIQYFYFQKKGMKEIAQLMGFSNDRVAAVTKFRCIEKLKEKTFEDFPEDNFSAFQ